MYKKIIYVFLGLCLINTVFAEECIVDIPFTNDTLFNENNSYAYDYSGYNHNAHIINSTYGIGVYNHCYIGNGIDSYIYLENSKTNLSFTNNTHDKPFTISCWFYPEEDPNFMVMGKGRPDHTEYEIFVNNQNRIIVYLYDRINNVNKRTQSIPIDFTLRTWHHVVITYDGNIGSGCDIYYMSVKCDTRTLAPINYVCMNESDTYFEINQPYVMGIDNIFSQGKIDEVLIFDYELNQSEIIEIFEGYYNEDFTILFFNEDIFSKEKNMTVYKNNKYIGEYEFGDTIPIQNLQKYTIVIHEDLTDKIAHIENLDDVTDGSITTIIYIVLFIGLIALGIKIYKRF